MAEIEDLQLRLAQIVSRLQQNYAEIDRISAIPGFRQSAEDKVGLNRLKSESAELEKEKDSIQEEIKKAVEESERANEAPPKKSWLSFGSRRKIITAKKYAGKGMDIAGKGAGYAIKGARFGVDVGKAVGRTGLAAAETTANVGKRLFSVSTRGGFTSGLVFLLFFAGLADYIVTFRTGFARSELTNGIDIGIYLIFTLILMTRGMYLDGLKILLPPFLMQILFPHIVNLINFVPFVGESDIVMKAAGALVVLPWWCIFSFFYNADLPEKNRIVNWCMYLFFIYLIVSFFIPAILSVTYTAPTGLINQEAISSGVEFYSNGLSNFKTSVQNYFKFTICSFNPTKPTGNCTNEVYGNQQTLQRVLQITPRPTTDFTMDVTGFTLFGTPIPGNNMINQYVPISSKLGGITMQYSCGIKNLLDVGTAQPSTQTVGAQTIRATENPVKCTLQKSAIKEANPVYYFSAEAIGASSGGSKAILFLSKSAEDAALHNAQFSDISSENIALQSSKLYGATILLRKSNGLFGSFVGDNDLAQPVLKDGIVSGVASESPYVYGIDAQNNKIDFALYVKNNGPGRIASVTSVDFTLPEGLTFNPPNCGITPELLHGINYNLTLNGMYKDVTSCSLVIDPALTSATLAEKTVLVRMTYNYLISKSATVSRT